MFLTEPLEVRLSPRPDSGRVIPLPLLSRHSASRAAVTCKYRCGNACAHEAPNPSANPYFGDVVRSVLSRRGALKAGGVLALSVGGAAATANSAAALPDGASEWVEPLGRGVPGTDFSPIAPNQADQVVIPEGYQQRIVIRWGDPVVPGAPEFDYHHQTAAAQEKQFGYNNDFAALLPLDRGGEHQLLVVNHEYTTEPDMFPGYDENNPTEEQVRTAWAAHGLSVVHVVRDDSGLSVQQSPYNRRITLNTPFEVRGPAAGSDFLKTSADPTGTRVFGTQNNCAGGVTPWGTILSGEENIHQYFAHAEAVTDPVRKERLDRYGMADGDSDRKWERFDKRWDLGQEPNEPNRFGWIVEIDPKDPTSTPVKHTALGRFKHEGATIKVAEDGRVVAYSGDDERFEYIYKFVSSGRMKSGSSALARRHNMSLLDDGVLYVAKFTGNSAGEIDGSGTLPSDGRFDGGGEWLPLASGDRSFVPGMSAEEVYVFTRTAADRAGATKMDRPEDIEPNPVNGRIYCALTNNTNRGSAGNAGPDEANPRVGNKHGQVLELDDDATGTRFGWNLLLVCGDPDDAGTYFGGFDKSQVSPISCPDNVAFDRHGNLWITTDGNELDSNDGLFAVPVEGAERGRVRQFLTVPVDAETCGPVITDDLVIVSVQHPGESDDGGPTSHWPEGGNAQPRSAVVAVWRTDGGQIG